QKRRRHVRHDHVAGQHLAQRRGNELEDAAGERRETHEHSEDRRERLQDAGAQLEEMRDQRAFGELLLFRRAVAQPTHLGGARARAATANYGKSRNPSVSSISVPQGSRMNAIESFISGTCRYGTVNSTPFASSSLQNA